MARRLKEEEKGIRADLHELETNHASDDKSNKLLYLTHFLRDLLWLVP